MRSGSQWGRFFLTHALSQKEPSPLTPFLEDPMTEIYRFRKTGEKQPESLDYLKKALAIRFPDATIEVYKDDRGRPLTDREDLWVSASHTGEWVFCGLSDEPLGIDAQVVTTVRNRDRLVERFFTKEEADWLKDREEEAFFDLWSRKEAFAKYTGRGIAYGLQRIPTVTEGAPAERIGGVRMTGVKLPDNVFFACAGGKGDLLWIDVRE